MEDSFMLENWNVLSYKKFLPKFLIGLAPPVDLIKILLIKLADSRPFYKSKKIISLLRNDLGYKSFLMTIDINWRPVEEIG